MATGRSGFILCDLVECFWKKAGKSIPSSSLGRVRVSAQADLAIRSGRRFYARGSSMNLGRTASFFGAALGWLACINGALSQNNAFLQKPVGQDTNLDSIDNVRYLQYEGASAALLVRPFIVTQSGETVWLCKKQPAFAIAIAPDTAFFVAMINAGIHDYKFEGRVGFHSPTSFVGLLHCDADGFVRGEGFPALPYLLSARLPQGLGQTTGRSLVAHVRFQPDKTTDISLTNVNIVGPQDTVRVGQGVDFALLKSAYKQLPTPSREGVAADEALSAIDKGDLRTAAAATIRYVEACVQAQQCADALRRELVAGFQKNEGWFEFFGLLATAGLSAETEAAVRAVSAEETALAKIGTTFREAAVEATGDKSFAGLPRLPEIAWSSSEDFTSAQTAIRHWMDHSREFPEYSNAKQYIDAAGNFIKNPPPGTLQKIRPNGDILLYDKETNTFTASTGAGLPRTMFKPRDGINYWNRQ